VMQGLLVSGYGSYIPNKSYTPYFAGEAEKAIRDRLLIDAGSKCACCGEPFDPHWNAEFHHRNPEKKRFHLNHRDMEGRTMDEIMEEYRGGEFLHSECHKKAHKHNTPARFDSDYLSHKAIRQIEEDERLGRLRGKIRFSVVA